MVDYTPPADLMAALTDILGKDRLAALLGPGGDELTSAMNIAALTCFRQARAEDDHTRVLRRAFAAADRGEL